MIKGIEHFAVCAHDTAALTDWYVRIFGFKVVYDNGKGTYFVAAPDGSMIEIIKAAEDGGKLNEKVSGFRHMALAVDDFEAMVEKLMAEGVEVVAEPIATPTGIKTFFFKDVEGNIFHLIYRPTPLV